MAKTVRETITDYTALRGGDRVVASALGKVPGGGAVVTSATATRAAIARPRGLATATLYADQHGALTVERRAPRRVTRRTYAGLTLHLDAATGEWRTADGHHGIALDTPGWYVCDAPHPVRGPRGTGDYCWGGVEHAYAEQWCPFSDDSNVDSAAHGWDGAMREAATHLAAVLASMDRLDDANTPTA